MFPITHAFTLPASVTIPNGAALSNAIDIRRYPNAGYVMPAAWTAAAIGFKVSLDGVNFFTLKNAAGAVIEHAAPAVGDARCFPIETMPFTYVKLWSQTAGANVNQAALRMFVVGTKG